jgi:ABC-type enterochelin transport system permease subunit
MKKITGMWIIPFLVAAVLWLAIYDQENIIQRIMDSGRENPIVFIIIVGIVLKVLFEAVREYFKKR